MDRAWGIRVLCRPLLVAALAFQAITPVIFDDTSFSQSLLWWPLPGDSSASSSVRDDTFFPEGAFAVSGATPEDLKELAGAPERHFTPYWPCVTVARPGGMNPPARVKVRAHWYRAGWVALDRPAAVATRVPVARVTALPLLLCRFLC